MMEKLQHEYGADALSEALEVSESGFAAHRGKQGNKAGMTLAGNCKEATKEEGNNLIS